VHATYILPIRREQTDSSDELAAYLRLLSRQLEVIVVDGSPPTVFAAHARAWGAFVLHIPPDPNLVTPMGKVGGVLTGLRRAGHEALIIADDDVRYDLPALTRIMALLAEVHVVRPQNYFDPLPWHARWDTARTLLNRVTGGDWPGTLAVRRSALRATGGYAGDVLFENLELVRTVRAAGGREIVLLDLYVRRLPPNARHFWSQRVRQAYDEWARPLRFLVALAVLPLVLTGIARGRWTNLAAGAGTVVGLAEMGRRRAGGHRVFPPSASLLAPAWLLERALCTWLALGARLLFHGMPYRSSVLPHAATSPRVLRRRHGLARHML
jgi:hypothetical protein